LKKQQGSEFFRGAAQPPPSRPAKKNPEAPSPKTQIDTLV